MNINVHRLIMTVQNNNNVLWGFKHAELKYMTTKLQNAREGQWTENVPHFEHYQGSGKVTICIRW